MDILNEAAQKRIGENKKRQKGATLVEYALIIGLISLVIVGVLASPLKEGLTTFASNVKSELTSASSDDGT